MAVTLYAALSAVTGFLISVILGPVIIPVLKKLKFGQKILEIGPKWHMGKQGTPTMGGIMFILGSGLACIFVGIPQMLDGDFRHIIVFLFELVRFFEQLTPPLPPLHEKRGLSRLQSTSL